MRRFLSMSTVLLLLGAGLVGCDRSTTSAAPQSPAPTASKISVFLEDTIDDAQRVAVEQQLRSTPGVRDTTFVTRQESYEQFKELFKDDPDLISRTTPESLPESFRVTIADGACVEAYDLPFRKIAGVSDVDFAPTNRTQIGVVVQLRDSVTAGQRSDIERAIAASPGSRTPRFETSAAAAERLRHCSIAGVGDLSASLRFAYTVPSPTTDRAALEPFSKIADLDGVQHQQFVPVEAL